MSFELRTHVSIEEEVYVDITNEDMSKMLSDCNDQDFRNVMSNIKRDDVSVPPGETGADYMLRRYLKLVSEEYTLEQVEKLLPLSVPVT